MIPSQVNPVPITQDTLLKQLLSTEIYTQIKQKTKKNAVSYRQCAQQQIIQPLLNDPRFRVFHLYPSDEYPDIAQVYLKAITFPVCLQTIQEQLLTSSYSQYQYVGDLFRDLCLISSNCRKFNQQGDILIITAEFENQLLILINQFLKNTDQILNYVSYLQFQTQVFKAWPPGKIPSHSIQQRKKNRSPYREEADQLVYRMNRLNDTNKGYIIACLCKELQLKSDNQGQIIASQIDIDLQKMKPCQFWWLYDLVKNVLIHQVGQEEEQKIGEELRYSQRYEHYVDANQRLSEQALLELNSGQMVVMEVMETENEKGEEQQISDAD
ncbi:Bromodomain-containing_protein [Hexamita inflata]|uniref:Bromodomain-containing protein n=1 Tax=Hexamita inflata TaxID=28002 RepID=A0AA86N7S5_9EUKA|nr:Bromodomain-containing protein [Hexamita inflata]